MKPDRLDQAALGAAAVLLAVIGLLLARGDQVGVQIIRASPQAGSVQAATQARIALTFSEPMNPQSLPGRIECNPPVPGALRWNGNTAFFIPSPALAPDTVYTVTVRAGAVSARGRRVLADRSWSFRTGRPRVIYLSPALEPGDLYATDVDGGAPPTRLTTEPYGVYDYAVSPDGSRIAYSANRDETGQRDVWLVDRDGSNRELLVACDDQVCQSPAWDADGVRVAYERRALVQGAVGRTPGASRIWVADAASKATQPLLADSEKLGVLPHWAPDGSQLAYYSPLDSAIAVLDTAGGATVLLPSVLGDPGAWSPDGRRLIYPELRPSEAGQFSRLLRADLAASDIVEVMAFTATNDSSVSWSPDGTRIAFSRQRMGGLSSAAFGAFGPQVWISTPDGQDAHPLTDEPEYSHGGLRWSLDGAWLATVRYNLRAPNPRPEVWLIRSDGTARRLLVEDATLPAWLP